MKGELQFLLEYIANLLLMTLFIALLFAEEEPSVLANDDAKLEKVRLSLLDPTKSGALFEDESEEIREFLHDPVIFKSTTKEIFDLDEYPSAVLSTTLHSDTANAGLGSYKPRIASPVDMESIWKFRSHHLTTYDPIMMKEW
jgi:hypothetical protein